MGGARPEPNQAHPPARGFKPSAGAEKVIPRLSPTMLMVHTRLGELLHVLSPAMSAFRGVDHLIVRALSADNANDLSDAPPPQENGEPVSAPGLPHDWDHDTASDRMACGAGFYWHQQRCKRCGFEMTALGLHSTVRVVTGSVRREWPCAFRISSSARSTHGVECARLGVEGLAVNLATVPSK